LKEKLSSNQISVEEYFFLVSQDLRAAELNLDVLEDCMGQRVYLFENQNENPMRNLSSAQIYKADKMRRTQDSLRYSQEGESGLESQSPALRDVNTATSRDGAEPDLLSQIRNYKQEQEEKKQAARESNPTASPRSKGKGSTKGKGGKGSKGSKGSKGGKGKGSHPKVFQMKKKTAAPPVLAKSAGDGEDFLSQIRNFNRGKLKNSVRASPKLAQPRAEGPGLSGMAALRAQIMQRWVRVRVRVRAQIVSRK